MRELDDGRTRRERNNRRSRAATGRHGLPWIATILVWCSCLLAGAPAAQAGVFTSSAPSDLAFGPVGLNVTVTDPIMLTSDPGYSIALATGSGINTPFSYSTGTCDGQAGTCTVDESFTPTSIGTSTATLTVDECPTAGGTCIGANIPVSGTGYSVLQHSAVATLSFGSVALNVTATDSIKLTADKGYAIDLATGSGINVPFSYSTGTCNGQAGACTVEESFTPTSIGSSSGTLSADECPTAGGTCIPASISVSGAGYSVLQKTAPASVNFGSVTVNTTATDPIKLTSDKGYAIALATGSGINVPFSYSTGTCLGQAGTCTVEESYIPTALGKSSGILSVDECPSAGGTCIPAGISLTGTGVPAVTTHTTPIGRYLAYAYSFSSLSGKGALFIPILDPSAIVPGSLPAGATLIENPKMILADWLGSDNTLPAVQRIFDDPTALLEIPEDGNTSLGFSLQDENAPVNGPILADGLLIDPPVPGLSPAPEPSALWLLAGSVAATFLARRRRCRALPSVPDPIG
jgi:hypothetical protein